MTADLDVTRSTLIDVMINVLGIVYLGPLERWSYLTIPRPLNPRHAGATAAHAPVRPTRHLPRTVEPDL